MPSLRFETADLVIKPSAHPNDWFFIHSAVAAASSPVLTASLSKAWTQSAQLDSVKHPATGEDVLVRTLALKQIEETFFLEGKV